MNKKEKKYQQDILLDEIDAATLLYKEHQKKRKMLEREVANTSIIEIDDVKAKLENEIRLEKMFKNLRFRYKTKLRELEHE